jgi:hypothetical protein
MRRRREITFVRALVVLAVAGTAIAVLAPAASARRRPPTSTTTSTTTTTTTTTRPPNPPPKVSGYDVSWPQCGQTLPTKPNFAVVGASNGLAYSDNPCLGVEFAWAATGTGAPALYLNTANPGAQSVHWATTAPKPCSGSSADLGCAYNYGWNAAAHAFAYATAQNAGAGVWWLDIEIANTWSTNVSSNVADIQGMVDFLQGQSRTVGIYSTSFQWNQITGGKALTVLNWVAGATSATQAATWCAPTRSFTGGTVALVQYPAATFDGDVAC